MANMLGLLRLWWAQWSDGCKSQYKCFLSLALAFEQSVRQQLQMHLLFSGRQHGERAINGIGSW